MGHALLDWSIRASLIVLGVAAIASGLRLRSAAVLHRAWAAALAAMLLLPVWTAWGPKASAPILPAVREVREAESALEFGAPSLPAASSAGSSVETRKVEQQPPIWDWERVSLGVYAAGALLMLARLLWGTWKVQSMIGGARRAEGFLVSPLCSAPVVAGWWRPVLLLPECWRDWSAAKFETVLIHEREHIRRRDPLVQWFALLNRCVFWFHPLAWWLERKLAALAEDACDDAVLASGHCADDYAGYLIDIARSVSGAGARIQWAGALPYASGNLSQRIQRIVDGERARPLSRATAAAAVGLCVVTTGAFLACKPSRRSAEAASKTKHAPYPLAAQQRPWDSRQDAAIWQAALSLTPPGSDQLTAVVKTNPSAFDKVAELIRYHQSRKDWQALDALTLWFIQEHPELRMGWGYRPEWDHVWDESGSAAARQAWAEQMKKVWESPLVYMNAAEYLSGYDNEEAERDLLEGQRRFPSSALHWEVLLARHYTWALIGNAGAPPVALMTGPGRPNAALAEDAYARKVRAALLASKDVELLDRTMEQLQGNAAANGFSQALNERVLAIDPENREAHARRYGLRVQAAQFRGRTDAGSLSDSDRMLILEWRLMPRPLPEAPAAEGEARQLLELAGRNTKDPDYGTAVFLGNMALSAALLDRGETAQAAQRLVASSEAPPTDFLRYQRLDLSLARKLVDAGERESVVKFLDNCARWNAWGKQLKAWAAEIG